MWTKKLNDALHAVRQRLLRTSPQIVPAPAPTTQLTRIADDAATALGGHLRRLARNLDQQTSPIGLSSAAKFTASKTLEQAGKYFENEGFDGALSDLGKQVKKNPLPFIAVGVGLGFLIGRLLPSRRN